MLPMSGAETTYENADLESTGSLHFNSGSSNEDSAARTVGSQLLE
jgi:hypothetical protein